ncbi:MAG: transglutaminase N-terminal domain-containing protein [Limnohabitans sp.]
MRLSVQHDTVYDYRSAVETAQHTAHLQPRETALQSLLGFELEVSPTPEGLRHGQDAFGNPQAWWTLVQPHTQLRVVARSTVQTSPPLDLQNSQPWEAVREHFRYRSGQPGDAQTCLAFGSHHAPLHEQFAVYARASFTAGRPLQDAAIALMRQIHQDFSYASQSTDVHTPALEALQARRGVCQDFAHILIACLRSLGLAARYVSGYLLTHPPEGQPRLIGADASHAWASVYLPELASSPCGGWLDLDPTNDRWGFGAPGEDHVVVAWGRDFADVSPLRGVLQGGQSHSLQVAVSVSPVPEDTA